MKKIFYAFAAVATVAALASCAKEFSENAVELKNSELRTFVFNTSLEKTVLDGTAISWEAEDSVKILYRDEEGIVCSVDAAVDPADGAIKADMTLPMAGTNVYAVYPHTREAEISASEMGDSLIVKISNSCDGTWKGAHIAAAACTDFDIAAETNTLNFKNIANVLKFEITSNDVTNLQLRANDETDVVGTFAYEFFSDTPEEPILKGSSVKMQVDVSGPGVYYAPVKPNVEWISGFSVAEFNGSELKRVVYAPNAVAMGMNTVLNLGVLEDHIAESAVYFVTPTGSGAYDGSSWENAGDAMFLRKLLCSRTGNWMIHNHDVYLSEGEYDLWEGVLGTAGIPTLSSDFEVVSRIYGGYSASSTGTDVSQRDVDNNETIITNKATDKYCRVLYWSGYKCDQTFDGITFKVQDNNDYRGCLYANNGVNDGKLSFINCSWKNANIKNYGAVGQFADYDVLFKDCTIKDNVSTYENSKAGTNTNGGTVLISNTCNATFDNCLFENNTTHAPGSAILVASGTCHINNCIFRGNETAKSSNVAFTTKTANSGQSGTVAIVSHATNFNSGSAATNPVAKVYIDNCVFEGNKSCTCAADIYAYNNIADQKPILYINRCYFNGATINGAALKLSDWFQSKSILTENTSVLNAQIQLCIYNSTIGPSTSTVYSSSPTISSHYGDWTMVNTTVVGGGVATLRNNAVTTEGRTSAFNLYNCAVSHTSNSTNTINLSNSTSTVNCGYNIMGNCKNKYDAGAPIAGKPVTETDGYVLYSDMNWNLTDHAADKYFTFDIAAGKEADPDRPVVYTTAEEVAAYVAAVAPDFDAWLKTIHADPYSIDIRGELRNPDKVQKGSWDPCL